MEPVEDLPFAPDSPAPPVPAVDLMTVSESRRSAVSNASTRVALVVTAASELARNTIQHGGGGMALLEALNDGPRRGLRLTFEDQGPGIPDLNLAMKEGFTTAGGLGLGLSGAKRLTSEFAITSAPGTGTRVVITKWK